MFTLHNGDCLQILPSIPSGSIDAIITDLPYGVTDSEWDSVIPLDLLWKEYERIIKTNGAIILTASQPFTNILINSNQGLYKYCWYWIKSAPRGFANAKKQPLRAVEEVCIFYKNQPTYNPILIEKEKKNIRNSKYVINNENSKVYVGGLNKKQRTYNQDREIPSNMSYPRNTLFFNTVGNNNKKRIHSNQKPVELIEYLIRTYTKEGEIVLDSCMGSGTTIEAAERTGRNSIGIEKDEGIFQSAVLRLKSYTPSNKACSGQEPLAERLAGFE